MQSEEAIITESIDVKSSNFLSFSRSKNKTLIFWVWANIRRADSLVKSSTFPLLLYLEVWILYKKKNDSTSLIMNYNNFGFIFAIFNKTCKVCSRYTFGIMK